MRKRTDKLVDRGAIWMPEWQCWGIELNTPNRLLVDTAQLAGMLAYTWHETSDGYARTSRRVNKRPILTFAHKKVVELAGWPLSIVDHINGDKLDCRLANLRQCDRVQNQSNRKRGSNNTSGFKGVTWNKGVGKWQASIQAKRQPKYLGLFATPEEAHDAYCKAASELHGEFARLV